MEVLGVQARNPLRYLQQEVAEHGCVGDADRAFVVTLENAGMAWLCKAMVHQLSSLCYAGHEERMAAAAEQGCQACTEPFRILGQHVVPRDCSTCLPSLKTRGYVDSDIWQVLQASRLWLHQMSYHSQSRVQQAAR